MEQEGRCYLPYFLQLRKETKMPLSLSYLTLSNIVPGIQPTGNCKPGLKKQGIALLLFFFFLASSFGYPDSRMSQDRGPIIIRPAREA
jgi:hypothetical protein